MAKKRRNRRGDGQIEPRGPNTFRLRYTIDGKRHAETLHGSADEARKQLKKLTSIEASEHVAPVKLTVSAWIATWIEAGAPGRKRKRVGQKTLERYEELLRVHVTPVLGKRPLQKLAAIEIDKLYRGLEDKIAPMTQHHVHVVFSSCLSTAVRKGLLATNPMVRIDQVPSKGEADHGIALSETELGTLVAGFQPSALYPVVALAASTGCRRNELLALRWSDLDVTKRTLRIERALDFTKKFGIKFKVPKTERGKRTIELDDGAVTMLLKEREKHLRIKAGVPDNADVSLSLTRLPADALMFPGVPAGGFSFIEPRNPRNFTKEFLRRAKRLGFADLRFHDLRGTHATQLLNRRVPVHVVAQRLGDDPAVVLRNYAKHIPDNSMSDVLGALASGLLKS